MVRESLTNATRHAPGAEVAVRVERGTEFVGVSVDNPIEATGSVPSARRAPGAGSGGTGDRPIPGVGLAGLRTRVEVLAGTFHAAPQGDRFVVTARIPVADGAR